jgi:hypothetical protein
MEFETKPLTLAQRVICNHINGQLTPDGKSVVIEMGIEKYINYCRYGLKSLGGVEITDANFESEMMKLGNDEIREIGDKIAEETNFPKKK